MSLNKPNYNMLGQDVHVLIDGAGRLSDIVTDVKSIEYGAKGDGVTDDTAAIQNAINSLPSGQTLYFPNGNYIIGAIHLKSNIRIIGDKGTKITAKDYGSTYVNDTTNRMFYINDSENISNLTVEEIEFVRPNGNCAKYAFYLPTVSRNDHIKIRRCKFTKMASLFSPNTDILQVEDCEINDTWGNHSENAGNGSVYNDPTNIVHFMIAEGCSNIRLRGNIAKNIISFCYINAGTSNSYGGTAQDCIIEKNYVEQTGDTAFFVRATSYAFRDVVYDTNTIINCGKTPIKAEVNNDLNSGQFKNVVIKDNIIEDYSVYLSSEAILCTNSLSADDSLRGKRATITGNKITKNTSGVSALHIKSFDRIVVSDNEIEGVSLGSFNYCSYIDIKYNEVDFGVDTTQASVYGATKIKFIGNTLHGTIDGVLMTFDQMSEGIFSNNIVANDIATANITTTQYGLQFRNTGGEGNTNNAKQSIISNNLFVIPNLTYSDDNQTTTAKPISAPGTLGNTFFVTNNAIKDSTGNLSIQGATFGGISNFIYYNNTIGATNLLSDNTKVRISKTNTRNDYVYIPIIQSGTTGNRPTSNLVTGQPFFDTTLNKQIWRNNLNNGWVDATGITV